MKAWTPYKRNSGPADTTLPTTVAAAETLLGDSGLEFKDTGHTEWPDGRVHHAGVTVTFTPNTNISTTNGGNTYPEADFNSWQEGRNGNTGSPTYAFITARSYHPGVVNAVLLDGSTRTVSENIDIRIWHWLGARNDGEVVGEF